MEPINVSEGGSRIKLFSSLTLMLGLFLLPIAAVPLSWFPFELTKLLVFTIALSLASVLFLIASFKEGSIQIPRSGFLWVVLLLPLTYLVSSLLSQNKSLSYIGSGTEVDTMFFMGVCAVTVYLFSMVLGTRKMLSNAYRAMYVSLLILALLQTLQLFFGPNLFGIDALSTLTSNIFGKWNDLGMIMGLLAILSVASIDLGRPGIRGVIFYGVGFIISIFLLAAINIDSSWQALVGASVLLGVGAVIAARKAQPVGMPEVSIARTVPYLSLVTLAVSIVFVVWGGSINTWLSNQLSLSALEVRPSIDATMQIAKATYAQSTKDLVVGTGPATFVEQWLANKPVEVNASQFWGLDFKSASGVVPTAFVTTGLLGGIAWVLVILMTLFMTLKALFRPASDAHVRMIEQASLIGSLFIFATLVLYTGSQAVVLFAFILAGMGIAAQRIIGERTHTFALLRKSTEGDMAPQPSRIHMALGYVVLIVVLAAPVSALSFSSNRFIANFYLGQALIEGDSGNLAVAEEKVQKSLAAYRSDNSLRVLANIKAVQARNIINEGEQNQERAERFNASYRSALEYGQFAINEFPRNYQNWLLMAQLFEALMPLNIEGAYDSARQGYVEAIKRNPRNPGLYLSAARMEANAGNEQGVLDATRQAITLKPNYTEAALFIVQLEVARNNIDGAIQAATAAVASAPENAGIWFQLGLLYYVKGDAERTIEALSQALRIVPDYANAKYFFGLTLDRMNRRADAITVFEDLAKTNGDNEEVKLILSNLRAGKEPFDGSKPPVTPNPETRPTPPIEE